MNKVLLVGRVGKDPEKRTLGNDQVVSNFTLATSESYKDKNGEWQESTEWHNCSKFSSLDWLKKGDLVEVEGSIHTRKTDDGKYFTSIRVARLSKLQKANPDNSQQNDDDLPY